MGKKHKLNILPAVL